MKIINLRLDEKFFYKLEDFKNKLQREEQRKITWEKAIMILFGMS